MHTENILLSEETIKNTVKKLASKINEDFTNIEKLIVIGILKGSMIFISDLIRQINIPLIIDFFAVESYGNETESTGNIKILKTINIDVTGEYVLLLDDLIDSGLTLHKISNYLQKLEPRILKKCVLLNKPSRRIIDVKIDYCGLNIPDEFVVGYGMDYKQLYRNLPYITKIDKKKMKTQNIDK